MANGMDEVGEYNYIGCNYVINMSQTLCAGFDMRNSPRAFLVANPNDVDKFRHCTVIEGNVHILLMAEEKNITKDELEKIRFVNLREITGYLLIFQARLFKSLKFLFPELRIIRGRELVHDYALVVLQNEKMDEIGLSKLTEISNGGVRILFNYQLCFVHTINWSEIIKVKEFVDENKLQNACPEKCSPPPQDLEYCSKRPSSNSTACWTSTECQKVCPTKCRQQGLSCSDVNLGQCCHRECVGGCNGTTDADCYACRNVFFQGRCQPSCPVGYYKVATKFSRKNRCTGSIHFYDRRCLTEDECHNKTKKGTLAAGESSYYKASNLSGLCDVACPTGYEEDSDNPRHCRKCPEETGCKIICAFDGNIKSMQEVGNFVKRCNVLNGPLEIAIQGLLSAADIKNLEKYLSNLHEVRDYVKVSFTPSLVSLNILKNLKFIRGKNLWNGKYALSVFENANLATLWTLNPHKSNNLVIERGQVQMLNNPQLCYQEIKNVINGITLPHNVTEYDVSPGSNGNRAICEEVRLKFNVTFTPNNIAKFHWERFNTTSMDQRMFLGYRIYFKETTSENASLYENRDMCLDSWTMIFVEPERNSTVHDRFKPFTLYAFYIQTLTVNSPGAKGGISDIVYRHTNFIAPSEVLIDGRKTIVTPDSISIHWRSPIHPNGQITHYKISYQSKLEQLSYDRDYCSERKDFASFFSCLDRTLGHIMYSAPDFKNYPRNGRLIGKADSTAENVTRFCAALKCCECKRNVETAKTKEDDHQSKLNFVTMILSYINKPKYSFYRRKKRSSHIYSQRPDTEYQFPFYDSNESLMQSAFNSSTALPPSDRLFYGNNVDSFGPVTINVTGFNYTLQNLTHFTAYEIKIWACQNSTVKHNYCSQVETVRTEKTEMIIEKDRLNSSSIRVENVINQSPDESIIETQKRVFWDTVDDPNGRIVAYEIQYHRQTSSSQTLSRLCVSASTANFNLSQGALLVDLLPGNYSLQLRAVSLAQRGPLTYPVWFFIPERQTLSNTNLTLIILAFCIISFGGLFIAVVYCRYQTRRDCAKHFSGVISISYYHTQRGTDLDDPYGLELQKCHENLEHQKCRDDKDSGMGFDNNDDNTINDDNNAKEKIAVIDKLLGVEFLQLNKWNDEAVPSVKIVTNSNNDGDAKKGWLARFLSFIDPLPNEKELFKIRNAAYEEVMAANALRMQYNTTKFFT
uniref:receptor protein-tyrosine kinase n=1 Tax=Romanomermis culicivorax TaxID=13658 RepID=A0A915L7E4_ROMCU